MAPTRRAAKPDTAAPAAASPTARSSHKRVSSTSSASKAADHAISIVKNEVIPAVKDEAQKLSRSSSSHIKPRLPVWAQFPLLATLSFSMASMGYSLLDAVTKGELASVSRSQDTWGEVAVLAGWRLTELAVSWFGNFDCMDVAALDLLSHGPSLYLLTQFYGLSSSTTRYCFMIDVLSAAIPFYLLRPLSAVHIPSAKVHNRELVSWAMQIYTGALATVIYSVVAVLSLRLVLPRIMVQYFNGIPSLEPAYGASYVSILPMTVQFGAAASVLLYAPFATTDKAAEDEKIGDFNPASATLGETVAWNVSGYTAKTKVIVKRTAIAAVVTAINTYLACTMTIFGIQGTGAAVYASVWATAAVLSGVGLAFVGGN